MQAIMKRNATAPDAKLKSVSQEGVELHTCWAPPRKELPGEMNCTMDESKLDIAEEIIMRKTNNGNISPRSGI